jgi:glycosyltransferase involved in cell wall biosynthesis
MAALTKRAFHFCRVWGSRHGGSLYSAKLVEELTKRGWSVWVLAERFEQPIPNAIALKYFFRNDLLAWFRKPVELVRVSTLISRAVEPLVVVQGDLPRLSYLLWQLFVPVIFLRQDAILTCPAGNRVSPRSRAVCDEPLGLRCAIGHGHDGCGRGESWIRRFGRLGYRARDGLLLRGFTSFVANSQYIRRLHGKPGLVLYPPRLTNRVRTTGARRDLKRLVFCGRLEQVKGASEAIEILKLLPTDYHLEVLGDGVERQRLRGEVERCGLDGRVNFHGWVDAVTHDSWVGSAGAVLIPSLCDEAFGMVGPEAFAMGTPVVAYDVGGISEWCREGAGILVACGDVAQAAAAVLRLTQDRGTWDVWSAAALRVVDEQFPLSRFSAELDAVLNRVPRCE